jgi:spermidine dehydrogenase
VGAAKNVGGPDRLQAILRSFQKEGGSFVKSSKSRTRSKRAITRRDFIHDVSLASLGLGLPVTALTGETPPTKPAGDYPPIRTGLRGAHPGSFEVAHALAREGKRFDQARLLDESWDLIVVGGGLSGLSAAYYYRKLQGPDARILVLDNHDDFGGHAKRNEFHQGGPMRLAWGGTINMEYPLYSAVAMGLLTELGIDIPRLLEDFKYSWAGNTNGLQSAVWFDKDSYGADRLVPGLTMTAASARELAARVDEFPISEAARESLKRFLVSDEDVLAGRSDEQKEAYLRSTSYADFLATHFELPGEVNQILCGLGSGYYGVRGENLSVAECLEIGMPGAHVLGDYGRSDEEDEEGYPRSAMFPDGNASIARLLVRSLIPEAFPGMSPDSDPFDIVTAQLDYSRLDAPLSNARLRLRSTAVQAENTAEGGVSVRYVRDGEVLEVRGRQAVLACYNRIIPHLCPDLPEQQKAALAQCIKRPLLVMNVELRDGRPLAKSGIAGAYLPGRLCHSARLVTGVNVGDYRPAWRPEDPCVIQFYGAVEAPNREGLTMTQQNQAGRLRLLGMSFEDFEREIITAMNGIWGAAGFDPAEDILAITVNRWPHGYARDHLNLEDAAWNADPPPNVIGRQPFGNITIANSDAGADAFTHTAIDQAWRAVNELPGLVRTAP